MKANARLTAAEKIERAKQLTLDGCEARIADEKMTPRKVQQDAASLALFGTLREEPTSSAERYWARPYKARVETSHFSGTFAFETIGEAIDYIFQQFAYVRRVIDGRQFGASWVSFDCYRSHVEGPDCGTVPARYILNVDRLQSH